MCKIYPVSLGCPKNKVDFEKLLFVLTKKGAKLVLSPDEADLFWINTCAFIRPAIEETLEHIFELGSLKRNGQRLVVSGCLTARYGVERLRELLPEVDEFYGIEPYRYFSTVEPFKRVLTESPFFAYLKISEGCNKKCTYCTIPQIRGPLRSKPAELLIKEAQYLLERGVRELILVAQDVTSYGLDVGEKDGLLRLVERLSQLPYEFRIRILYLYPKKGIKRILKSLLSLPKVTPYFDLPIQHAHPKILKGMQRPVNLDEIAQTIEDIRKLTPEVAFRTTVMVGFPGEEEREFNYLREFLERVEFDYLGVFTFYPEEGTKAEALVPRVSYKEKVRRKREILRLQREITRKRLALRKGKEEEVLILGEDERNRLWGIARIQAPEIDGISIFTKASNDLLPGSLIKVRIEKTGTYDLYVRGNT